MNFNTGDTGFMLIATSLVMLMTPGLAFFYGGLVGRNMPASHAKLLNEPWRTLKSHQGKGKL